MFIGHAVEIEDEPYLVPIEGELGAKDTLIPLKWLYGELARCPAQQKVLIVDVCRFNPARGLERPGSGPMGAKLDAVLGDPPAGVQVWTACVAGQFSYEGTISLVSDFDVVAGYFLTELAEAVGAFQRRIHLGAQVPSAPLPLETLADGDGKEIRIDGIPVKKGVHTLTAFHAKERHNRVQTPRLSGRALDVSVAYAPAEPLPLPLQIGTPNVAGESPASLDVVQQILDDTETKLARMDALPLRAVALPAFSAAKLAEYADDGEMTPFREEVTRAANLVKKHAKTFHYKFDRDPTSAAVKKEILEDQRNPARAMAELMGQLETLKEIEPEKANEKSKRWQANFDYVCAKLHAHLAYVYEYNFMLAQIRRDALPTPEAGKPKSWSLAASHEMKSGPEGKKLAAEAKKRLDQLAKDHAGTPWEVMAKRQALTALGLEWRPGS
jgi:hypothetical protein